MRPAPPAGSHVCRLPYVRPGKRPIPGPGGSRARGAYGVLALLSREVGANPYAARLDRAELLHEESAGNHRSSWKSSTAWLCAASSSGASGTVGRRPLLPVVVRTSVARMPARLFIIAETEASVRSAIFARLTSIRPMTVAKVCKRSELSARWNDGPHGT